MPQRPPNLAVVDAPSAYYNDYIPGQPFETTASITLAKPAPSAHRASLPHWSLSPSAQYPSQTLYNPYRQPDQAESVSEWSAASYSQPSSLRNDQAGRPWSPSHNLSPYAEHESIEAGHGAEGVSEKGQRDPNAAMSSPTGSNPQIHRDVISYTRNEEPQQSKEHAGWILVRPSRLQPRPLTDLD